MLKDSLLLITKDAFVQEKIDLLFKHDYIIIQNGNMENAFITMKSMPVGCVAITVNRDLTREPQLRDLLKLNFHTPFVAVLPDKDLELARRCGAMGFNSVVLKSQINKLADVVPQLVNQSRITIKEFGYNTKTFSKLVIKIIEHIEKNYLNYQSIKEVAGDVQVSPSTISRAFKKYNLISPKKLLLYMKLKYALYLLQGDLYHVKEISEKAGFKDEKRFNENFQKVFSMTPTAARDLLKGMKVKEFWNSFRENRFL